VFRSERTEGCRRIAQHRAGMQNPLVESERIHERLECRTRRSLCQYAIHLAIDRVIPVARRSNPRFDRHVPRVDEQRCDVVNAAIAVLSQIALDLAFNDALKAGIKSRVDPPMPADSAAKHRISEMRRHMWQGEQACGTSEDHR